jgi:glutathione synthase/RimK-type ligase-like ATP-grasp enzyme
VTRPSSRADPRARSPEVVALVSYQNPDGVPAEDLVLAAAFRRHGIEVAHPIWDDPSVDWSSFGIALVRSTWDYYHRRPQFLAWVNRARRHVALWNPPRTLRWNTDKRYLTDLARKGVPTVPTHWVRRGTSADLRSIAESRQWTSVVVKRTISAAGHKTYRFGPTELGRAQRTLDQLAQSADVMVQPYLDAVTTRGERSLIYLDGQFSHSVRRIPLFPTRDKSARESLTRTSATQRALADATLAAAPEEVLYARVDMVEDDQGRWTLMELEVTEPSLFFVPKPRAADLLVAGVAARLRR